VNSCGYSSQLARKHRKVGAPACGRAGGAPYASRSFAILAGAIAIILMLSWRGECWAYIDPNAGGFLWQIVAPLASIFLSFLFYCRKEIGKFVKSVRDRWKGIDSRGSTHEAGK